MAGPVSITFSGGDLLLGADTLSVDDAEWLKGIHAEEWRAAVALGHDRVRRRLHARRMVEIVGALSQRERWMRSTGGAA